VGTENTFVVTSNGGRSITGNHPGLIPIGERTVPEKRGDIR